MVNSLRRSLVIHTTHRFGGPIEGALINVVIIPSMALLGMLGASCVGYSLEGEDSDICI